MIRSARILMDESLFLETIDPDDPGGSILNDDFLGLEEPFFSSLPVGTNLLNLTTMPSPIASSAINMTVTPPISTSNKRALHFDPSELLVEELKVECKRRNLKHSGNKTILIKTLLQGIKKDPSLPLSRLSKPKEPEKKSTNKREPTRDGYATKAEFERAWNAWREQRDHNNESVKKSREMRKKREKEHETQCHQREHQNRELAKEVNNLKKEIMFLTKSLKEPGNMTVEEQTKMDSLMARINSLPDIPKRTLEQSNTISSDHTTRKVAKRG
eukprot:m.100899 g.100899  ORF g.100899 m.100899 type:complete len:272 (-) comp9053_c1_seq1:2310-3125(-)